MMFLKRLMVEEEGQGLVEYFSLDSHWCLAGGQRLEHR